MSSTIKEISNLVPHDQSNPRFSHLYLLSRSVFRKYRFGSYHKKSAMVMLGGHGVSVLMYFL